LNLTTTSVTMTPLASRGIALAILIALVGVLYLGVAAPLVDRYDNARQSIVQLQTALERYQRVGRELAPRQAELDALKRQQGNQEGYLEGASETLLAAQIQNRIKLLVDQVHGDLQSTQALPAENDGKLRRIVVRGQMLVTLAGAQRVFYELESATPLLFLDNVEMRVRPTERRLGVAAVGEPLLDVSFDVQGYSRGAKP